MEITQSLYDEILFERDAYRRELELYRSAFEAMVDLTQERASRLWNYRESDDADLAVKRVLRHRAQSGSNPQPQGSW